MRDIHLGDLIHLMHQLQNIDNLQKFLNENTKEYVDVYQHMYSHKKQLSDKSRDEIDVETRTILSSTCQQIDQLKATLGIQLHFFCLYYVGDLRAHLNSNTLSHLNGIVTFLYCKLQEVAQYFADQKSLRFKQAFEPKNGYFLMQAQLTICYQIFQVITHPTKTCCDNTRN